MRRKVVSSLWTPGKDWKRAALAALLYSLSTTLMNLANKVVFSRSNFNFPWATIAIQNTVSLVALSTFSVLSPNSNFQIQRDLIRRLLFPMWCFCVFLFSNAKALRYISLPVLTVLKSFAPLGVSVMEVVFFKDQLTRSASLCMLLVVASNYVTAANDVEFSLKGYAWAGINVASNIAYLLTLRKCLSETGDTLQLAVHSTLVSLFFIVPISLIVGDFPSMFYAFTETSPSYQFFFFASGLICAGITISTFWCLAETNGSTFSFLGAMNKIPIVLLGAYIFKSQITTLGWVGIFMSIFAGYLFARTKMSGPVSKGPPSATTTNGNHTSLELEGGAGREPEADTDVAEETTQHRDE